MKTFKKVSTKEQSTNIIFPGWISPFSVWRNVIFRSIFREKIIFAFLTGGSFHICRKKKYHFYQHTENIIFPWSYHIFRKRKCHLSSWYKKDHIPVECFLKRLFFEHLKNISYFHPKFIFSFLFFLVFFFFFLEKDYLSFSTWRIIPYFRGTEIFFVQCKYYVRKSLFYYTKNSITYSKYWL